ncbi:MAG: aminoglycoside 3'-phosphotransferase [Verrucomicrobia bacterium]|nr:aminoglycoside 3'-phosphotransferase [Verrucomicrobiota bacterium]
MDETPAIPPALADLLAGCERHVVNVGESGARVERLVRRDGEVLFLKQSTGARRSELEDEFVRLRWLAGRWPVPAVRHFQATTDRAWLLTEALPGRSAATWLEEAAPAQRPALVRSLGRFLRELHALPTVLCPFLTGHALRLAQAQARLIAGEIDTDDFDPERQGWSAGQVWEALQHTRPTVTEDVVTHGDFSLDNVFLQRGVVTGCLDVGRAGVADRYQDLAILTNCLTEFGPGLEEPFFDAYGLPAAQRDPRRLEFHRLLDECF